MLTRPKLILQIEKANKNNDAKTKSGSNTNQLAGERLDSSGAGEIQTEDEEFDNAVVSSEVEDSVLNAISGTRTVGATGVRRHRNVQHIVERDPLEDDGDSDENDEDEDDDGK